MIVFAPYPDNFCLDQSALSFYYYNINTKITNMILKTGVLPEGKKVISYISK